MRLKAPAVIPESASVAAQVTAHGGRQTDTQEFSWPAKNQRSREFKLKSALIPIHAQCLHSKVLEILSCPVVLLSLPIFYITKQSC